MKSQHTSMAIHNFFLQFSELVDNSYEFIQSHLYVFIYLLFWQF